MKCPICGFINPQYFSHGDKISSYKCFQNRHHKFDYHFDYQYHVPSGRIRYFAFTKDNAKYFYDTLIGSFIKENDYKSTYFNSKDLNNNDGLEYNMNYLINKAQTIINFQ